MIRPDAVLDSNVLASSLMNSGGASWYRGSEPLTNLKFDDLDQLMERLDAVEIQGG